MTKDVFITITAAMSDADGQDSVTELKVRGQYFERNGSRYLLYEEQDSDNGAVTKNTLKIGDAGIELIKSGISQSRMIFQRGETHRTSYVTPYGSLLFDIHTLELKSFWTKNSGTIQLVYRLSAEASPISENHLSVKIRDISDML